MEKDPHMEGAILHFAQAHTKDFVTGLEIGKAICLSLNQTGDNEQSVRDQAFNLAMAQPGNLQALTLGARAAIDQMTDASPAVPA